MRVYGLPKILILESQMIVAADVAIQLHKFGFELIGINQRMSDAILSIELHRPDIIVMNLAPGSSTGGIYTAKMLSEKFRIPLVFISAQTDRSFLQQLIPLNPYALITKPFSSADLHRGLQTTLHRMIAEGLWPKSA
ncbi:MAG: response regulator [Saprospiraceae bacterium]|nr:response regulator [Saprospiraceae bacterium]